MNQIFSIYFINIINFKLDLKYSSNSKIVMLYTIFNYTIKFLPYQDKFT